MFTVTYYDDPVFSGTYIEAVRFIQLEVSGRHKEFGGFNILDSDSGRFVSFVLFG